MPCNKQHTRPNAPHRNQRNKTIVRLSWDEIKMENIVQVCLASVKLAKLAFVEQVPHIKYPRNRIVPERQL